MYSPANPENGPLDVLRHYRGRAMDAEYVSLQGYEIHDMIPLVSHLAQMSNLHSLNLSKNNIAKLPEDLSSLSKLETLDLSNNPIRNATAVLRGLYSLPRLKHLFIHMPNEMEEDQLVATLSNLTSLNGIALDPAATGGGTEQTFIPTSATEMLSAIRHDGAGSGQMLEDHQTPRGYQMDPVGAPEMTFHYKPWTTEDTQKFKDTHNLVGRVAPHITNPDEYDDYGKLVTTHLRARCRAETDVLRRSMHQYNAGSLLLEYSFDELVRISGRYGPDLQGALKSLFEQFVELTHVGSNTMVALQEDRNRKVAAIQEDLAKELLTKERARLRRPKSVVQENEDFFGGVPPPEEGADTQQQQHSNNVDGFSGVHSLHQLETTMNLVLESKKFHDDANMSAKLPKETLEQHLYSYFYARTNTDVEIKNAVTKVFNSIKKYSNSEVDVEIFGLILRNELDENYWGTHGHLKSTLYDCIHSTVLAGGQERADITELDGTLSEDMCLKIVNTVFPQRDNKVILRGVSAAMRRVIRRDPVGFQDDDPRMMIGYREFVSIVLRAVLAQHMVQITPIIRQFRQLDTERSGVIDAAQFRVIVDNLYPGIKSLRLQELLNYVDPFGNNVIIFSDVVQCLSRLGTTSGSTVGTASSVAGGTSIIAPSTTTSSVPKYQTPPQIAALGTMVNVA